MSNHQATVSWERGDESFIDNRYSRVHEWRFDGGAVVQASSSPEVVPLPFSDPSCIDPEEAFVAALSSCHMLFFLFLAAKRRLIIEAYQDEAVGKIGQDEEGRQALVSVTLNPKVRFSGPNSPTESDIQALHQQAHHMCYLANSVRATIKIDVN